MEKMKKLDNYTSLSERIEGKLYQEIARMQQAKISQLDSVLYHQKLQTVDRPAELRERSKGQQVKHPSNKAVWLSVANFIDEKHNDLDEVRTRIQSRRAQREQLQKQKMDKETVIRQPSKQMKPKQIPWKVMREMMRKDVADNKRRLQRIHQKGRSCKKL